MKKINAILLALVVLNSCEMSLLPIDEPQDGQGLKTTITFKVSDRHMTRSSISPDENMVKDINIYAYRNGVLESQIYHITDEAPRMELARGYEYNFYALANVGEKTAPVKESEIRSDLMVAIKDTDDISGCLPMAWETEGISITSPSKTISISLDRLVAKIGFKIDSSLLNGLTVTSIRLCQSAAVVWPFDSEGSRITSPSEAITGDYASEEDLAAVNAGEGIIFYALENRQGVLLPDNTDPWEKVPDALNDKADLCTYIEIGCEFQEGFLYSGTVIYRFYPGADNTSDFSIVRNTDMSVTMYLTTDGLKEISWKVEPDIELQNGFAYGYLDESMHDADDLYVGERFYYCVEMADDLVTHVGGDLTRCSIALLSEDGGSIRFDNYDANSENGYIYARGTCTSIGTGSIWLCDPEGNPVTEVDSGFNIQKPNMIVSFYSSVSVSDTDYVIDEPPCCTINGTDEKLHIYLTDNEGHNLNNDYLTGFDLSLFSFEDDPYWESDYGITNNISIKMTPGTSESNGPAATYTIRCINDGRNADVNYDLSYAVRESTALTFDIDENNYHISGGASVGIDYQKITLTMVDNGWADYADCQLSLKVNNPSNMPLRINGWQVNQTNTSWNAISRNAILEEVENEMTLDNIAYITNTYYQDYLPLYGQSFIIYSERNSEGDQYTADGNEMVYPIETVATDDMLKAMSYNKCGQEKLHHLIDVTLPSGRLYSSKLALVDNLEDGSMTYSIIYGDDPENPGWNNQGMWLYSNGSLINKHNNTLDSYYNVTAKHLTDLFKRYDSTGAFNLVFTYDDTAGHLYARCEKGNLYNIKIDSEITGSVRGNVTTYPNGTWGSSKDNPCTATISGGVSGVSVGTTNVSIDGGAIKAGMNAIYNQTFYDSRNWIGSANNYQHRAHPVQVTVTIRLNVSSSSTAGLYPFTILWRVTTLPFYHAQDGTTYNPGLTKTIPTYSFCRVKRN